jgi:tRNA1(Val) A37 N6-methylase TrmN6
MPPSAEALEQRRAELCAELGEEITLDGLSGHMSIFQRKHGHRHSTDDLLTAYYAVISSPEVLAHLDLGTGIGTVGLLVAQCMPQDARLTCVEAQNISFRLLGENLWSTGLASRVTALHQDLRSLALPERFPLITGSPPYFPPGTGIVPKDSQKAHARFELRGDVSDYCRTARAHLAPDGLFVFCFPWAQKARAIAAAQEAGFRVACHQDVVPRQGLSPLFSLFACRLGPGPTAEDAPFIVRHENGQHTEQMLDVQRRFGWPKALGLEPGSHAR